MSTRNFRCTTHIVPGQHTRHYAHGTSDDEEAVLRLAVKQYTPLDNLNPQRGDLTIIAGHGIGMPKEMYEPLWDGLLELANKSGKFRIRSIWMVEAHNQGESGLLNEGLLGDEPSWYDTARDVLSIVNQFRKEMPQPITGIGHSFSAVVLAQVALTHLRLFTAIAMLDPALHSTAAEVRMLTVPMIALRCQEWPNKQAAIDFYSRHPMFKAMEPRALQLFFEHGLMQVSPGSAAVCLKTTPAQESTSFAKLCGPAEGSLTDFTPVGTSFLDLDTTVVGKIAYYRPEIYGIHAQLPFLQPSCLYLNPRGSVLMTSRPEQRQLRFETTGTAIGGSGGALAGRVRQVHMEGTHYFPLEHPEAVAEQLHAFMVEELEFFKEKQVANEARRADRTSDEHANLSKEYIRWAKILLADNGAVMKKRRDDIAAGRQWSKL